MADLVFPELGASGAFVPVWHPGWERLGVEAVETGVLWEPQFLINGEPALEAALAPEVTGLPSFAYVVRIDRADLLADRGGAAERVLGALRAEAERMHAETVDATLASVRALLADVLRHRGFPLVTP